MLIRCLLTVAISVWACATWADTTTDSSAQRRRDIRRPSDRRGRGAGHLSKIVQGLPWQQGTRGLKLSCTC